MRRSMMLLVLVMAALPATGLAQAATFADRVHVVGTDIIAGTFQAPGGDNCYWARLSGLGGTSDEIITNATPTGPVTVRLLPTDVAFESRGCGIWTAGSDVNVPTPTSDPGTAASFAEFLAGLLPFINRVGDGLPSKAGALVRFGHQLDTEMGTYLLSVTPEACYAYADAWRLASVFGYVTGLAGSRDRAELRAFAGAYRGPLFSSLMTSLQESIAGSFCPVS